MEVRGGVDSVCLNKVGVWIEYIARFVRQDISQLM